MTIDTIKAIDTQYAAINKGRLDRNEAVTTKPGDGDAGVSTVS